MAGVGTMTEGTIVTIGTFDGIHLGHQAILDAVRTRAEATGLDSVAYTFDRPPRSFIEEHGKPILLLPLSAKHTILCRAVDRTTRASFPEVRGLSPEGFFRKVLISRLNVRELVVGDGFRFGNSRGGTVAALREMSEQSHVDVHVVPPVTTEGRTVSSTLIRSHVAAGAIEQAGLLLGRPPLLIGEVIRGDRIGRRLGYPTANLAIDAEILLPGAGVYCAHAFFAGARSHALLYVGSRPTFQLTGLRCEVYLLRPPEQDLCGQQMEVHVLQRIRGDRAFPTADALSQQIDRDVDRAMDLAAQHPLTTDPIIS